MAAIRSMIRCCTGRAVFCSKVCNLSQKIRLRCLSSCTQVYSQSQNNRMRCLSSFAQSVTRSSIGEFELCSLDLPGKVNNPHPRPLVVLVGWLNARRSHLDKYCELYLQKGIDVLIMKMSPVHIVWPILGKKYVTRLMSVLQEDARLSSRQIVVHGFSIGAFVYTQVQLLLELDAHAYDNIGQRIAGIVMDSPAYIENSCQGIADSATDITILRFLINATLNLYLSAFPRSVMFHLQESERIFHSNSIPILFLYSCADKISSSEITEHYMLEFQHKGVFVQCRKWHDSPHVRHFRDHPEEYTEVLYSFLDHINLANHKIK